MALVIMTNKENSKYGEITTVKTIRITVVNKVPKDEEKALKIVEKDQERIIGALKKLGVDNIEILRSKTFENLDNKI